MVEVSSSQVVLSGTLYRKGGPKLSGVEKKFEKNSKKKSERLDQMEQENGW